MQRAAAALLLAAGARAQDYSPFTLLGTAGPLNGSEVPQDNFSPSDKVVACDSGLSFVDLDAQIPFNTMGPQLTLERCALFPGLPLQVQQWVLNTSSVFDPTYNQTVGSFIQLQNPPSYYWPQTCMDIKSGGTDRVTGPNATVYTWYCKGVPNQAWQWFPENGTIASADGGGTCLTVGYPGDPGRGVVGTLLTTDLCDPTLPPTQSFTWDPARNQIKHVYGNCVDAGHLGQLVRYDPSQNPDSAWSLSRVRANTCPDPGNPPFLPRASLRDYTVGVGSVDGADRLVILDGDSQDNNVWTSDDCGGTWDCFDGSQPWPDTGRALSVVQQAPTDMDMGDNNPLFMFGGVNYNADGDVVPYYATDIAYSFNGVQWMQWAPDTPWTPNQDTGAQVVWPGMVAADWDSIYVFGDDTFDPPNAIFQLPRDNFFKGFVQLPDGFQSNPAARSRYTFLAGASNPAGCWFATDYHAGSVWGGQANINTTSTNAFYTSFDMINWRKGPVSAPWAPRAGAGITPSADARSAWLVGGMQFEDGFPAPGGATFNDAWSVNAGVCLYGDNGGVCSGVSFGTPDLDTVQCVCKAPYLGQFCQLCPAGRWGPTCASCTCVNGDCAGNGTISGDGTCSCYPGWTGPDCDQPTGGVTVSPTVTPSPTLTPSQSSTPAGGSSVSPTPSRKVYPVQSSTSTQTLGYTYSSTPAPPPPPANNGATTAPAALSPGATGAIVFFVLLGAAAAGVYVYATYFGGGAVVAAALGALAKPFAGLGGGGGASSVETRGLLKPGVAKGSLTSEQAASRLGGGFAASGGSSSSSSSAAPAASAGAATENPFRASGASSYQSF